MLPDGRLAVMVGDVAGHGAESAARAARLRFGWRTLVDVDPDPARVLKVLNAQVASPGERQQGIFASMCHALISPDGRVRVALAGHPRPILAERDFAGLIAVDGRGPVLGLLDDGRWPVTELWLPEGSTLVLYTDGLTEARRGTELFGVPRACKVLREEWRSTLEVRLASLVEAARRFDEGRLRDDVAVLAVQRVRDAGVHTSRAGR
jgi:serine phosphatase RsbU (regulator of sigma subunit)